MRTLSTLGHRRSVARWRSPQAKRLPTQCALSVTNTATFGTAADKNIALDNANNFSTVVVTQAKDVTLNDTNALVLGGSSIGNDLTVTAGGAISDSGASTIGGTATFSATGKDITLDEVHDFATVAIGAGNNVTLNDTNALVLGASTIGGNLSVTATQSVTQSGALSVTGATTVATNAAKNIDLSNASNNFATVGITSANNVSLRDAPTLSTLEHRRSVARWRSPQAKRLPTQVRCQLRTRRHLGRQPTRASRWTMRTTSAKTA